MQVVAPTVETIQAVGAALGRCAQPGDLVMLNGPLGAGKTTMTQGIARSLGVHGRVQSPTFTIAQIHRGHAPDGTGLDLVHVDAYRLVSMEELDALDLDTTLDAALTVVEWGEGKTEVLSADRLEITIERPEGSASGEEPEDLLADAPRVLTFVPRGERARQLAHAVFDEPAVRELMECCA
ncbi:MAG: tRNA (adenosine(37)-N6)-threonylcarbamoyltransferase complex ATPase subunit type 1 TsaE [Arcanobacterium sp.]|nr:tRNA (adenosine(37)-N6)-threonylcarbamoyltransferase complex ATPase subunit type 1 TsaE [Arcanobacterium sp.]